MRNGRDIFINVLFSLQEVQSIHDEINRVAKASGICLSDGIVGNAARTAVMRRYRDWFEAQSEELRKEPMVDTEWAGIKMRTGGNLIPVENLYRSSEILFSSEEDGVDGFLVTLCFPEWANDLALLFKLTWETVR
ncbi:hypothetical protein DM806_13670 [Sphingobium lactosutens]|uniref:hypothetical protein n=1 Tax=Sphingobium lactosutens TaxID=522773 RepID=UPI0015BE2714|nr:hypothetical protein [Sphingobium lactosutens]NWK96689.1 hypothetical protein [Sphingobium lactosutens]